MEPGSGGGVVLNDDYTHPEKSIRILPSFLLFLLLFNSSVAHYYFVYLYSKQ
jgi:hypothetical protein